MSSERVCRIDLRIRVDETTVNRCRVKVQWRCIGPCCWAGCLWRPIEIATFFGFAVVDFARPFGANEEEVDMRDVFYSVHYAGYFEVGFVDIDTDFLVRFSSSGGFYRFTEFDVTGR